MENVSTNARMQKTLHLTISVVILVCILISGVFSFVPGSLISMYGALGSHHGEITKCALNEIAVEYLTKLGAKSTLPETRRKNTKAELTDCTSENAVANMCKGLDMSCREYGPAVGAIVGANAQTDKEEAHDPFAHFDAETLLDSNRQLIAMKQAAIKAISASSDYITGRQQVGRVLHTVQDYYAHTNWIELGNTKPNPAVGRNNDFGIEIALPYDDSCDDCTRVDCVNLCKPFTSDCKDYCFDPVTGCFTIPWTSVEVCGPLYDCSNNAIQDKLTSGFYDGESINKPDRYKKCSHGGITDASSHLPALGGINKDTNSNLLSPHYKLHLQAADMAKEATVDVLRDVWDLVGDVHFGRFLGILGSSAIGSLVIAMDTTGSMGDEIDAARESAKMLVDELVSSLEPPTNFILSPFNDPSVGPLTVTTDAEEFKGKIDTLGANGGGDGPEMCLTGILRALEVCERNSLFFVYTDNTAKDAGLLTQVISLVKEKESKIMFLLTYPVRESAESGPDDGSKGFARYDIYESIAASSGGDIITTTNAEIAEVSLDLINAEEVSRSDVDLVKVSLPTNPPSPTSSYSFVVDPTIIQLTIRASGNDLSLKLVAHDPSAPALNISVTSDLATLKTWKVYGPPVGEYTLSVDTTMSFTLSITGTTNMASKASIGTLELGSGHAGFFIIESEPVAASDVYVITELQGALEDEDAVVSYATFVGQSWETLSTVRLSDSGDSFTGKTVVPNEPFRILINGTVEDSVKGAVPFQRLQRNTFTPAFIDVNPSPSANSSNFIQVNHELLVDFTVSNRGPTTTVTLKAVDTFGIVTLVTPPSATLERDESVTVTVTLFADPVLAVEGAITTLTVSATTSSPISTNYATSRIIIMPEFIDSEPPTIILASNLEFSCDGVLPSFCDLFDWSANVWVNDTQSGLKSVVARNKQLGVIGPICNTNCTDLYATFTLTEEFEEGHTGVVEGIFAATCCVTGVDFVATDVAGNLDVEMTYQDDV